METVNVKITLGSSWFNNPPKVRVNIGDQVLFDGEIKDTVTIDESLDLDEQDHQLKITLYDKSKYDTRVVDGKIVEDTLIHIKTFEMEDIDLKQILSLDGEKFCYEHDTNGSAELKRHVLHDTLGCNGTATINFTSPFYIWLLENL